MTQPAVWAVVGVLSLALSSGLIVLLLRRHGVLRRRLHVEQVVRRATTTLVGAADRAAVRDAALHAAIELLNSHAHPSWRVDGDPAGTIAQATSGTEVPTVLDHADTAAFSHEHGGVDILAGPSLLHATLGVHSTHTLVLVALPRRGAACEAAIVATHTAPGALVTDALKALAGAMHSALERLQVGDVLLERRSERRLRMMLAYASDVICILDHDLTIVHVTPAVEPIVGLPAPELLGMSWLDLVAEADRPAAHELVTLAQGGRPARGELRLHNEHGAVPYVDAVVTEVIDEDLTGFVVTCHDITERFELEQQLTHQAFHDALTGLANRALFRDRLGHAMARARRANDYGVLFIDLDDFKTVNDTLGHAAGDELLREMTARIRSCLREGDTAARLGGDEFAVLLEDIEDDAQCETVAARMLAELILPFEISGTEIGTGASVGVAVGSAVARTPEELMRNADLALYDAKNTGKKKVSVFAQEMHDTAVARLSLTNDLRNAVERGELVVYYQPLIHLASGDITGLEALVRWNHPERGLLQPGEFIALAEDSGLIVPLGRAVLSMALHAAVAWQAAHPLHRDLRIAVNLSGRQLLDPDVVDDVQHVLRSSGINPDNVVIEITESVLVPADDVVLNRLRALADLGVHLVIDDFGTGFSSLSYLQTLPVDGIKLARQFVENLPGTNAESGLVSTIRGLSETMGMGPIVAEGIERREQWEALLALGYTTGQGYHLALPMPAELVPNFLTGRSRAGDTPWLGEINSEIKSLKPERVSQSGMPGQRKSLRAPLAPAALLPDETPVGGHEGAARAS